MEKVNEYSDLIVDLAIKYGSKLAGAIITLIIGLWVIKKISGVLSKLSEATVAKVQN